jgi:hypothetical protein
MRNQIFDYFCVSICTNKTIMYSDDYNQAHNQEHMSEDVYSKPVRAGKRTYFFDVKTTRLKDDFYLTITESKRRQEKDGSFTYDKHKIFLYKEDFEKFQEGLGEVVEYIRKNCFNGTIPVSHEENQEVQQEAAPEVKPEDNTSTDSEVDKKFTDIKFEEL